MSASAQKTILITGANRGIGQEIAKQYLSFGWRVVAGVRDVTKMPRLSEKEGDVVVVKIDSKSTTDAKEAIQELKTKYNITHLDIVLANAGIAPIGDLMSEASIEELDEVLKVNTRGPLVLYQATRELLEDDGCFAVISSMLGSITPDRWARFGIYGTSKAAVNFIMRTIHAEEPKLKVLSIHPGWVETGMGVESATVAKVDAPPYTMADTVPGIVKILNNATKEETSGWMWNFDGTKLPL
ncbi:hypothetical protein B9479_006990 [Cryptococcus floricola]|uniref:NAD(P)-binding protein n=1 Tax=Cryptococcus floricola TaxID=2591691 RepID=A0A5D3ALP7_9TREE|nr:hypothetical protein B9479_006990 [Cryptococcus floricola]